jgi:hypothetical protein
LLRGKSICPCFRHRSEEARWRAETNPPGSQIQEWETKRCGALMPRTAHFHSPIQPWTDRVTSTEQPAMGRSRGWGHGVRSETLMCATNQSNWNKRRKRDRVPVEDEVPCPTPGSNSTDHSAMIGQTKRFMFSQCVCVCFQCFSVRAASLNCLDDPCFRASEI